MSLPGRPGLPYQLSPHGAARYAQRLAIALIGCAVLASCKADVPSGVFGCESQADCPKGLRCAALDDDDPDERRCVDDKLECSGDAPPPAGYSPAATWTSSDISLCDVLCSDHEYTCIRDYCGHGSALATCVARMHNECSSQFGGECRAEWVNLWCCAESQCANEIGTDAGVACLNDHCLDQSNAGDECLERDTACLESAWDDCAARAGQGSIDAAVPRTDGGLNLGDAGVRLDAGAARDGGLDASIKLDASVDAALTPKDANVPRFDAAGLFGDGGFSLPDAGLAPALNPPKLGSDSSD